MFGNASENGGGGSLTRSARIAVEALPEIGNSNGVFRVTASLRAPQTQRAVLRARGNSRSQESAPQVALPLLCWVEGRFQRRSRLLFRGRRFLAMFGGSRSERSEVRYSYVFSSPVDAVAAGL